MVRPRPSQANRAEVCRLGIHIAPLRFSWEEVMKLILQVAAGVFIAQFVWLVATIIFINAR